MSRQRVRTPQSFLALPRKIKKRHVPCTLLLLYLKKILLKYNIVSHNLVCETTKL